MIRIDTLAYSYLYILDASHIYSSLYTSFLYNIRIGWMYVRKRVKQSFTQKEKSSDAYSMKGGSKVMPHGTVGQSLKNFNTTTQALKFQANIDQY